MSVNFAVCFLICVTIVSGQAFKTTGRSITTQKQLQVETTPSFQDKSASVSCICDGGCEHLRGQDCPFGLTFDMCRCCLVCARGEGEPCGGARGKCAMGLHCKQGQGIPAITNITEPEGVEGHCSRDDGGCNGHIQIRFGCVIDQFANCICSSQSACPGEEIFLFDTENECRSRMAYLIAKKDLEITTFKEETLATGKFPKLKLRRQKLHSHDEKNGKAIQKMYKKW